MATLSTIGQVVQSESTHNQTLNREKNVLILKHRVKHKIEKNNVLKHSQTHCPPLVRSGGAIGKIVASYFKIHLITCSSPHQTNLHQKYSIAHNAKVTAQKTHTLSACPPTPLLPTKYSKRIQKAWTGSDS